MGWFGGIPGACQRHDYVSRSTMVGLGRVPRRARVRWWCGATTPCTCPRLGAPVVWLPQCDDVQSCGGAADTQAGSGASCICTVCCEGHQPGAAAVQHTAARGASCLCCGRAQACGSGPCCAARAGLCHVRDPHQARLLQTPPLSRCPCGWRSCTGLPASGRCRGMHARTACHQRGSDTQARSGGSHTRRHCAVAAA